MFKLLLNELVCEFTHSIFSSTKVTFFKYLNSSFILLRFIINETIIWILWEFSGLFEDLELFFLWDLKKIFQGNHPSMLWFVVDSQVFSGFLMFYYGWLKMDWFVGGRIHSGRNHAESNSVTRHWHGFEKMSIPTSRPLFSSLTMTTLTVWNSSKR